MLKRLKSLTFNNDYPFKELPEDLLEKLPEDLGQLECLEKLHVGSKKIEYLPDSICMLKRLKSLNITGYCCLGKLPEDIGRLEYLDRLVLTATKIKNLPDSICMLKHLSYLDLHNCALLKKLPKDLGRLEYARFHFEIRMHQRLIDILHLAGRTIDSLMLLDLPACVDFKGISALASRVGKPLVIDSMTASMCNCHRREPNKVTSNDHKKDHINVQNGIGGANANKKINDGFVKVKNRKNGGIDDKVTRQNYKANPQLSKFCNNLKTVYQAKNTTQVVKDKTPIKVVEKDVNVDSRNEEGKSENSKKKWFVYKDILEPMKRSANKFTLFKMYDDEMKGWNIEMIAYFKQKSELLVDKGRKDVGGLISITTIVVNNSVFRAFFEKQRLTGPNFIDWYHNLRIVLSVEDKLPFLKQPIPAMPVPPARQVLPLNVLATYAAWVKASKEIIEQKLLQTVREFHACKQEEGQSVSSYVLKMKSYIDNLERLGHAMTQNLAVSLILVSLRKEYDSFVQNYNMHGMGKTVTELHAMLKLHEQTLPKKDVAPALHAIRAGKAQKKIHKNKKPQLAARGNNHGKGKSKLAYAPKPKIPPPPKKDNHTKDVICHQCGDVGHWKRNSPQYLAELLKNKKLSQGASTSGIFTIELYTFPNNTWVYDTGCGTHICITTQGLRGSRKLKPGALSLYVGDGHRAAVEAIGSYHLCLPISRNNAVYFSVILRNGIFEIDLSNSNTNDSSMYVVSNKRAKTNLDLTLLWHCRLRHISKKRIEKLQHDGLLNSTDNQSFDKCVSCMSGKMARKPYTHQVKRAKDLLGLIHTDVCRPFRTVSKQGASYFVTFTNDFSRYGYVYLLKHKHEVFETFKVFQKEVENQLGETIKSLRYDRGGEYISQEFLDHLKEDGIIAHRTPPYTSQHNSVSERRNRTLLDMVRSMMSQTTLPNSFWDYALESAARILNMVPTKKVEKTPYEIWHGQAPKLSYLKVWGCEALDTLTKPDKLKPIC
ncbi:retrotransposon protein, putative, ty1-copia subclass [Tanacetum coccineum]